MLVHNPDDLSSFVRSQRKLQGMSQTDIADCVGLKQATISEFENKSEGTKLDTLFRILSAANLECHIVPKGQVAELDLSPWDDV